MVKRLRKTKRNQKYDYQCNRKRKGQKTRKIGTVLNPEIRQAYNPKMVPAANIEEMGLAYDVNKAIPIRTIKQHMKEMAFELHARAKKIGQDSDDDGDEDEEEDTAPEPAPKQRSKQHVAEALERDAKEFRGTSYRLAKPQVRQITAMIDKHGFNYLAMERDKANYDQETWRQFRRKIRKFLKITEQSTPYLERKGWLDCDMNDPNDPRWKEYCTDDEV